METFLDSAPSHLQELRDGLAQADGPRLARTAHTLKGMLTCFNSALGSETILMLEKHSRAADLAACKEDLAALELQLQELMRQFSDWLKSQLVTDGAAVTAC